MNRRRLVSFMRQRDWPSMIFELLVVALGVGLGIQASNWNAERTDRRRTEQMVKVLRQDLRDGIGVEEGAAAEVDAGLAAFDAAVARGERPAPYVFRIPGADNPPDAGWQATLQSGVAEYLDPNLLFDLGFFYSERQGIAARYSHYARFMEDEVLSKVNDPAQFYGADGRLKPEYAANMDRLRDWRFFIGVTIKTAKCLDGRFARPSERGPSCRPDYGHWPAPGP